MRKRHIVATGLLVGLLWTQAQAPAQQQPLPDAPAPATPSAPAPKDKSKTPPASSPKSDQSPEETPTAPAKKPSTADDNPFPEDVSRKAEADAKAVDAKTPSAPSTAKHSDGSSSLDGMDKLGLDDPSRRQLKLESPDGSPDVYDPKRATEDLRVGRFYLKTGDFKGAYARFKDATVFDHENVEAVFWLAEAARKMNLPKEAEQNYQVYLEVVPDGPNAKVARKALGELASAARP